ncbi:MAG: translation initiation factor IF-2 [Oscillospiraceae bacterium]|nr:translation initiation factor IF-2 [Oscillospiraceae bacterium]
MSTKQTQTKIKIGDIAKDLNIANQEIAEFISEKTGAARKPSASVNQEELNMILEHYSQNNQVDSFDAYFASRNDKPAPKAAEEKKPAAKKSAEKKPAAEKKAASKAETKQTQKTESAKPAKQETPKLVQQPKEAPKAVEKKAEPEAEKKLQQNTAVRKDVQKSAMEKFESQIQKTNEQKKNQAAKAAEKKQDKPAENTKSTKTKLDGNFSAESVKVEQKMRTVDTRGSYVDIDKYNEKYENIAPLNGGGSGKHGKDNFSKKQKLTQKSAQRNKQQYSKKETEAEKLRRLELERARKQQLKVLIPDEIVVSELASRLKVTATEVIKKLMGLGEMCTINQVIDFDTASLVAEELGAKVEKEVIITIEERLIDDSDDDGEGIERAPVVVVMGHVDHGKTSLLDRIRNANVTASEAGGITQHIGAYRVTCNGKEITFLDTPGHEAFTSMRARGASITDIAILVVAADDGIMPQTVEAINHAKAAGVSIIVAINKMDKETANPNNIMQQLTEHSLVVEEWGGDVICVPVSAKTGMGIDELLENVLLVAEVAELKANPNRLAKGTVIEARLDKGRGPIATVLVQNGTLRTGDIIIAGTAVGRVRVMTNDKGVVVHEAGPSYPVEITGLAEVPSAGDILNAVEDERLARELVEQRKHEAKQEQFKQYQKVTLDNLFSQIEQGEIKELPIIVKADVQGSVEAVKQSLEKLSNEEVRIRVIHGAVGAVSEGDVMLASASNAIIVGFNVRPDPVAADNAERDGVDIRLYRIIYDAIEEISTAMKGMLAPKFREVNLGRIEVRQVYKISSVGLVAGSYVLNGKVTRASQIRVVRDGIVIAEDKMSSLKRFKDDVKEVAEGYECGITLEKFNDIKEGDIFESFIIEEYRPD